MKDGVTKAIEILEETEDSLKMLMQRSLRDERYGEVATIARIAEGVTALIAEHRNGSQKANSMGTNLVHIVESTKYPRFVRSGEFLVKEGWSKKNRNVYRHQSTLGITRTVVDALASRSDPRGSFKMDDVVHLVRDREPTIKRYQMSVSFGWLRTAGLIAGTGRSGYRVDPDELSVVGLEELWESLPESAEGS